MRFYFKNPEPGKKPTSLLFAKQDEIFEMNFETETMEVIYKFDPVLKC